MFLERNSFTIEAAPEAVRDFMLQVARIELELDGILAWLARHVEIIKVGKDQ